MKLVGMRWKAAPLVIGFLFALALAGFVMPAQGVGAQDAVSVSIHDFTFDPGTITITAGTTVTWTNNDAATHTVTADDGAFDSGNLATGQSFSMTFDTPGTFTYHCTIHPNMTATVVVTDASASGGNEGTTTGDQTQTDTGTATGDTTDMSNMSLPDTGAGHAAASHSSLPYLVVGLAVAGLATAGVGLRRRRSS